MVKSEMKEEREKPGNINTGAVGVAKDDCSDLTDNHDAEEQAPKSFPQKVRIHGVHNIIEKRIPWMGLSQQTVSATRTGRSSWCLKIRA